MFVFNNNKTEKKKTKRDTSVATIKSKKYLNLVDNNYDAIYRSKREADWLKEPNL